jgi:integrase
VNLRSLFHLIYDHARRWELTDRNPIDLVRQRGGRRCIPRVLAAGEIRLLLEQLGEPYRTMILVAACLGLRASEIMGLQWGGLQLGGFHGPHSAGSRERQGWRYEDRSLS